MRNEVVVITGARGGIGRALAGLLHEQGAAVAGVDRPGAAGEPLPAGVLDLTADLSIPGEAEMVLAKTAADLGPVTRLAVCHGVLRPATLAQTTDEDWDAHLAVNLTATFRLLRAAAGTMPDGGSIVVVGSNSARVPRIGMGAYAAGKAAVAALVRVAGLELAGRGIRCNVVEPGSTDTAMQRDLWPDAEQGRRLALDGDPQTYRVGIPLRRLADPVDVAEVIAFLLSTRARHVTMQRIGVDGGGSL